MASRLADIRDKIVKTLEGGTYSRDMTVRPTYEAEIEVDSQSVRKGWLFVRMGEPNLGSVEGWITRFNNGVPVGFDILVFGLVDTADVSAVDEILCVAEETDLLLRSKANSFLEYRTGERAHWVGSSIQPMNVPEEPKTNGIAQFIVSTTYVYEIPRG